MDFWTELLALIEGFLKQYWPALAVLFFNAEEDKVARAVKEKEKAQLDLENLKGADAIKDLYAGKSDDSIIHEFASSDDKPKPK